MAKVVFTQEANDEMYEPPRAIAARMHEIFDRLEKWPQGSGAKPLRHELAGHYRIRTGDFRVVFRVIGMEVLIVRIDHRKDVHED